MSAQLEIGPAQLEIGGLAPADTIIKSVSERPNDMFPPGKHVRARRTSVTHSSEQKILIGKIRNNFGFSEFFSDFPKYFRIIRKILGKSENFSENPKFFRIFRKSLKNFPVFRKKVTTPARIFWARMKSWLGLSRMSRKWRSVSDTSSCLATLGAWFLSLSFSCLLPRTSYISGKSSAYMIYTCTYMFYALYIRVYTCIYLYVHVYVWSVRVYECMYNVCT